MNNLVIFLAVAIGMLIGALLGGLLIFSKIDALLGVDTSDPNKDRYNFIVLCPLEELRKKKYLIVEVKVTNNEEPIVK